MKQFPNSHQTHRGFPLVEFSDHYGSPCSLQVSSLSEPDCVWLGVGEAQPKILAQHAAQHGVQTQETTGWVPYPLPEEVLLTTRMHLTRDQVIQLRGSLKCWLETGKF